MTSYDLNIILSEIRSAREADDTARLVVNFARIAPELREDLAGFAGIDGHVDEDGWIDDELIRQAVKDICDLPNTSGNADMFLALHAMLSGYNAERGYTRWTMAHEAPHLGHYVYDGEADDFDPNDCGLTLVLGHPDAHWMEPCDVDDQARLIKPTWDADEGTGDIVCAFPVAGKWVAWSEVR